MLLDLRPCLYIERVEFSIEQTIDTSDCVKLKYDVSDVEFLNSAVDAVDDDYNTSSFFGMFIASVGAVSNIEVGDNTF